MTQKMAKRRKNSKIWKDSKKVGQNLGTIEIKAKYFLRICQHEEPNLANPKMRVKNDKAIEIGAEDAEYEGWGWKKIK